MADIPYFAILGLFICPPYSLPTMHLMGVPLEGESKENAEPNETFPFVSPIFGKTTIP